MVAGLASDRPQLAGRSRLGAVCESLGQWPVMAVQCGLKHLVVWSIILSRGPLLKEVCAGPSVRIRRRDLPAMSTRSSARRPRQHDHPQCPSANPRRCRPDERAHLCNQSRLFTFCRSWHSVVQARQTLADHVSKPKALSTPLSTPSTPTRLPRQPPCLRVRQVGATCWSPAASRSGPPLTVPRPRHNSIVQRSLNPVRVALVLLLV